MFSKAQDLPGPLDFRYEIKWSISCIPELFFLVFVADDHDVAGFDFIDQNTMYGAILAFKNFSIAFKQVN
ncbi:hypothetical protein C3B55_00073 [Candidatus Pseudomonas adelgestsugas]|uniref:Uncharacterized protein n=1 Tax=Candidatus Pseudomonas adelgestsugas TaxID=1302376 RepID=A0ABX5R726_9PSED|nr:hypothetical protein C3B55_00073 [Candidatus Pseudomonas adelgestsugas]